MNNNCDNCFGKCDYKCACATPLGDTNIVSQPELPIGLANDDMMSVVHDCVEYKTSLSTLKNYFASSIPVYLTGTVVESFGEWSYHTDYSVLYNLVNLSTGALEEMRLRFSAVSEQNWGVLSKEQYVQITNGISQATSMGLQEVFKNNSTITIMPGTSSYVTIGKQSDQNKIRLYNSQFDLGDFDATYPWGVRLDINNYSGRLTVQYLPSVKATFGISPILSSLQKADIATVGVPFSANGLNVVTSADILDPSYKIWVGTKAQYNAVSSKDSNTIYFVKP